LKTYRDKIALITGGASGIGAALSKRLAEAQAEVWITDCDLEAAEHKARELREVGARVQASAMDVTDAISVAQTVNEIHQQHGRIDYLFNNAGVGAAGEVRDLELDDWERVMSVNFSGVVHGVHAVYPLMLEQGFGHIVNVASGAGLCPRPGMVPYAASKHAVVGLSMSLRAEAADLGVQVSVACPGYVATQILKRTRFRKLDNEGLQEDVPFAPMPADRCAEIILRGVAKNKGLITVGKMVSWEWWLQRFFPGLEERLVGGRGRKIRARRRV